MKIILYIVGTALIVLWGYARYQRGKQRFERVHLGKWPEYKSYNVALKARVYRNFIHFLAILALVLGVLIILFTYFGYDSFRQWMQLHEGR